MDEQDALDTRRVELIARQRKRVVGPVLLADLLTAGLAYANGYQLVACLWFLACIAAHLWRAHTTEQALAEVTHAPRQALARLNRSIGVLGAVKALILPTFFLDGVSTSTYITSMVTAGIAAGGISSSGAVIKGYVYWGAPQFVMQIVGWALAGGTFGWVFSLLWVILFMVLVSSVRDHRAAILELVRLVAQRELLVRSLGAERDRARQAAVAKTRFFAAASHDLRQPVHALSINTTTLELIASQIGDRRLDAVTRSIGQALDQTRSLLDSLLDVSKLDAGVMRVQKLPCDLVELLRHLCAPHDIEAQARGMRLVLDVQGDEGATTPRDWRVLIDPELLQRLVSNLLSNAMKFTSQGQVSVSLSRPPPSGAVSTFEIAVSDTGCGIADEHRDRVFEEFYQVGNPGRDRSKGLGLGLAIVRRIGELMEATVSIESTLGVGTRVSVLIPYEPCEPAHDVPSELQHAAPGHTNWQGAVLLVDDEQPVLLAMQDLLTQLGWQTRIASSGDDARRCLESGSFDPDVLLIDYRLGDEDGIAVAMGLSERFGALPTVVLTGETSPEVLQRVHAAGLTMLHKPADGRTLVNALRARMAQHPRKLQPC